MSVEKNLSKNQKKALASLIEYRTIKAAAAGCGLSDKTIQRYLRDPVFKSALAQRETDMVQEAGRTLVAGQMLALKTLFNIMEHGRSETAQRLAASTWMNLVLRWRELKNIEERIAELEVAVYGKTS